MLSTSSPSTTRTDWAGLKWNWTPKQKTNATFICNSEVFSRSSCLTGLFLVTLPATHKSSAVFYFCKVAGSCCSTNQRMSYSQCPCVHFKDWEPIPSLPLTPRTLMSLARLSRELISRPSLQACKQEITFWVSMRPGRIVRPDRLPWKYCVNLGVATSPPNGRGDEAGEEVRWDEEGGAAKKHRCQHEGTYILFFGKKKTLEKVEVPIHHFTL